MKMTNMGLGPIVLNVKDKADAASQLVLQPGETQDGITLLNPKGAVEQGLIAEGRLLLGELPPTPATAADLQGQVDEALSRADAAEKAEADAYKRGFDEGKKAAKDATAPAYVRG